MMRRDLLTDEEFIPLRINQKFARPMNRVIYYNNKANELRHKVAFVNKPLHINIRILDEIMKDKTESIFHQQFLLGKGFSFNVHTHYEKYDGKNHNAIYQYIILRLENDKIKIIRND